MDETRFVLRVIVAVIVLGGYGIMGRAPWVVANALRWGSLILGVWLAAHIIFVIAEIHYGWRVYYRIRKLHLALLLAILLILAFFLADHIESNHGQLSHEEQLEYIKQLQNQQMHDKFGDMEGLEVHEVKYDGKEARAGFPDGRQEL